ncbi:MAG: DUF1566 domain-containing protein [Kiritimatiellae bacterium]|jgi:hypothetical protein|nr:DUF1566 domain-containing protein [Kiritimatiellia bacterium]
MKKIIGWWVALLLVFVTRFVLAADIVLLTDDFNDSLLDSSKWSVIKATGSGSGFIETSAGSSLTESGGFMNITQGATDAGGAYKTALLPVNAQGTITIQRRTKVHRAGQNILMMDGLVNEAGGTVLGWGYFYYVGSTSIYGFGGRYDARFTGVWDAWFDEEITYNPVTGQGTYSINGGTPVTVTGSPLAAGITSVYLRGGAYGWGTGHTKQFDSFTVSQVSVQDSAVVTNLSVGQIEGTRNVQISYDLIAPGHVVVDLAVMQSGSNINAVTLSGALGLMEAGTNQMITWEAGMDWNGQVADLTFNLLSEDGLPMISDINGVVDLAQTGQTNSYAVSDDGDLQFGVDIPSPRYTNNGNNTVTDNLTGFIWWRSPIARSTWEGALGYADYANSEMYGGRGDWRLANIRELMSLLEFGALPLVESGYPFTFLPEYCWSSTSIASLTPITINLIHGFSEIGSWRPNMYSALVAGQSTNAVSCVLKTGQTTSYQSGDDGDIEYGVTVSENRFTDNGNGTVVDNLTGLMWFKDAGVIPSTNWNDAVSFCSNINFAGYDDWRLPNMHEMESLVDYGEAGTYGVPSLPANHPFLFVGMLYWSSTTYTDTDRAYSVRVDNYPYIYISDKIDKRSVLPVRGGN